MDEKYIKIDETKIDDWRTIGQRLKKLRKESGATQQQVADFLKMDQSNIVKIEQGKRKIKLVALEKLCTLYMVEDSYILTGKPVPDPNRPCLHVKNLCRIDKG